jgi:hydroxymethylglutaryl-CoA lyase
MLLRLLEVGPRDGLQNERAPVSTDLKLEFVRRLAEAGLNEIEATSFVSAKWVPQLGDAEELWPRLPAGPKFSALVPNLRGLERALEVGVDRIAVFTAASEAFTLKNINMTIDASVDAFAAVMERFREVHPHGWVRGYVSTAFTCPYSGPVPPEKVEEVCGRLAELGVDEISIGDTVGVAAPPEVREMCRRLLPQFGAERVAWHFHDTNGTGIANVWAAYEEGARIFDSSAAGLGGCPYSPGAGGNVATEDVVYLFERAGISTGVDLRKLAEASLPILEALGRKPFAKAQQAALAQA